MTTTSDARKRLAEAADPHAGCKVGTCKAEDQWRRVSCAGGGGDVEESQAQAGEVWQEADRVLLLCVEPGVTWGDFRGDRFAWDAPTIARPLRRLLDADGNLAAALAAQPAAPQPTEGAAEVVCTNCEADDLGCTACGAHGTLIAQPAAPQPTEAGGSVFRGLHADLDDPREHSRGEEGEAQVEADAVHQSHACEGGQERDDQGAEAGEHEQRGGDLHACQGTDIRLSSVGEWLTEAEHERILAARSQRPEGVTVTEWGYRALGDHPVKAGDEGFARRMAARLHYPVIARQRTTFPDVVTEWAEVSGDTEAGDQS